MYIKSILFIFPLFLIGCGAGTEAPGNSANRTVSNANTAANSKDPLAVSTPTPDTVTNNAPTLTPVYKAYCAAVVKKDESAIRKIYSQDTIKFFESEMKADGIKSLVEYLADDQVSNELCEVSNEKIKGETAVARIKTTGYPNGIDVVFVKENGEWKITNKSPTFDAMKKSAN